MKAIVSCDLCGAVSFHALFTQRIDHEAPWSSFIGAKSFPLQIGAKLCNQCGWLFLDPTYDGVELEKLYAVGDSGLPPADAAADRQRCQVIRRTLAPWLPAGHMRLLDVGGGSGELTQCFAADDHAVTVVDMSNAPTGMPGMAKVSIPFLEWSGGEFDVVLMSHVLEHTASPTEFLEHAKSTMAKDGLLFIEVPFELLTPLIRRHVGDHRHLGFFSTVTLRGFLDKAGLECLICRLTVGRVGDAVIPVIRAVARKRCDKIATFAWRPSVFMMARSLMTILNPLPWLIRGGNKLAGFWR